MEISNFKCRASKIGDLMTNGRGKNVGMGETAKTYLKEWVVSQMTGKQKQIESKYFAHGIYAESLAIERAEKHFNTKFPQQQIYLENEYFTGSFDAADDTLVIDTKCPFDVFTFPYFDTEPDAKYYGQLQIYMELTGLKKASLVYCLENHSEDEIDRLAQKIAWKEGKDEPDMEHWDLAAKQLTYDNLPDAMRIRTFDFMRDDAYIEAAKQRVIEAREYIAGLKTFGKEALIVKF